MKILTGIVSVVVLLAISGFVLADVATGEVGAGGTPGDQTPRICIKHRDVNIGYDTDSGINIFDYRTGLYAFTGEQVEYTAVVRDPNGILDLGFLKALVNGNQEAICNPVADAITAIKTDTLCYKSASTGWTCGTNTNPSYANAAGTVTYVEEGEKLLITVELAGLKPDTQYQLTLNGRNGNDGNTPLGNNCDNPNGPADGYICTWECGFLTGGTGLEGFWNFDLEAMTDGSGDFTQTYTLEMPVGHYGIGPAHDFGFGFIVKEVTVPDSCNSATYVPVLMETSGLDWTIVPEGVIKVADCNGFGTLNQETDLVYHCLITVEEQWYAESDLWLAAYNSQNVETGSTHVESWFFNPAISIDVTTSDGFPINFEDMPYMADTPEERTVHSLNKIKVKNTAEGGVNLWMFVGGTDLYDPLGASKCPITNYIAIEQQMQYRGWSGTQWTSWEGWNYMHKYNQNDGCSVMGTCYGATPVPMGDQATPMELQHVLTNQGTMEIEFKLTYPMPCIGTFSQGTIYVFGKAV